MIQRSIQDVNPQRTFCECHAQTRDATTNSVEVASTAVQIKLFQQVLDGRIGGLRRLQALCDRQVLDLPGEILHRHATNSNEQHTATLPLRATMTTPIIGFAPCQYKPTSPQAHRPTTAEAHTHTWIFVLAEPAPRMPWWVFQASGLIPKKHRNCLEKGPTKTCKGACGGRPTNKG
jgi:hypothetical protein